MKKLFLFLSLLFLTSCKTVIYDIKYDENILQSYIGYNERDLLKELGKPSRFIEYDDFYFITYKGNKKIFKYNTELEKHVKNLPEIQFYFDEDSLCKSVIVNNVDDVETTDLSLLIIIILLISAPWWALAKLIFEKHNKKP